METIILGRKGDQPFAITADGVSSQHAKITIDGDKWTLEDLHSTNGTFIRDEKTHCEGGYHPTDLYLFGPEKF